MYASSTVGVVIPAYNEAQFIGSVIQDIPEYVDRIYVVDDASTDGTWGQILAAATTDASESVSREKQADGGMDRRAPSEGPKPRQPSEIAEQNETDRAAALKRDWNLESMAETNDSVHTALTDRTDRVVRHGRVVAIQHGTNQGAGGAIKTGYLAALVDAVDAVATIDGDGQMDPQMLSLLLDQIVDEKAGYAKGNRLLYREYRSEMPTFRLVGNSILTFLTKIASGYWRVMDPQNGYTVISRQALKAVGVEDLYEGYGYCNELLIKLNVTETRIADVPTAVNYSDEESHIRYSSYIPKVSLLLLTGFLWRLKTKYFIVDCHPLVFFYVFGAGITGFGTFGGLYTLWSFFTANASVLFEGLLSTLLVVTGLLFLLFAMVFDRQANDSLVRPQQFDAVNSTD
ncbi:glycosyltransferase family 2 protein [Haloarcula marina]|uniref:glycosyltransferase family 2 protein n=1 Tax=Haloarcula marina TaxID=2961574 RepID=UPI0020B6B915|nr:glycosyltransferase family 2 protein [Halomicroarcula marina]